MALVIGRDQVRFVLRSELIWEMDHILEIVSKLETRFLELAIIMVEHIHSSDPKHALTSLISALV